MGINLPHLASKGRAYSAARCWTAEELDALLLLEKECNLNRMKAADYVRNGVMTVEDFEKVSKKGFKTKSMDEAHEEAEKELKKRGRKASQKVAKK